MTSPANDPLLQLLSPHRLTEVVDVGANPIDGDPPYSKMLAAGLCRVTGFEPQEQALNELLRKKGPHETYLPHVIADGEPHTLRICKAPGMTSLYEPDMSTLALFDVLRPLGEVVRRVPIQTRRLDDVVEIENLDFLKIDVQGAELSVFRSGTTKLSKAVVIQTEISFLTLYQDQPPLGEVDLELRKQGFVPHCFAAVKLWPIAPCVVNNNPRQPLHQLLEADICYVRDFSRPESIDSEQLKHLALVVHHCYRSVDLALRCMMLLEGRGVLPPGSQQRYLDLVSSSGNKAPAS
jgi:FkbM family methyltransferase